MSNSNVPSEHVPERNGNDAERDPFENELDPDHALLQRAQQSLKSQLLQIKLDLDERVREKQKALKVVVWKASS